MKNNIFKLLILLITIIITITSCQSRNINAEEDKFFDVIGYGQIGNPNDFNDTEIYKIQDKKTGKIYLIPISHKNGTSILEVGGENNE